eukprot:TRINITY_DN1077_c0_g1_i4.p1 TRINITY_DN1077_c0_g1~~TRINITY_DN1077_c0_g1_i4.p1  ORF type:complete len:526 (+),score=159.16 TRINITY_DN1077_c0_g1_i4:368-1945(+)
MQPRCASSIRCGLLCFCPAGPFPKSTQCYGCSEPAPAVVMEDACTLCRQEHYPVSQQYCHQQQQGFKELPLLYRQPAESGPGFALAGRVEHIFMITYLRDLHDFAPLAPKTAMVHGLLEATGYLCPSRTVSLPYEPAGCSASAAVFWSTVGLGSFLCGAARAVTERYAAFAARALRACFDEPDTQVVHAYLQLGLLQGMLGHYAKARRYVHFSQTLYAGLQAQGQAGSAWDSNEGGMLSSLIASFGPRILDTSESEQVPPDNPESLDVPGMALAAKRGKVSRPFDALRIMLGVVGFAREALEPASPPHVVQQNVQHLVDAWDAAGVIMTCTTLSGCIAARAPQLLLRGSTLLMQERVEEGLADIEQGLALALQQPNLIRFSLWWHAIHCGVIGLAHHGRIGAYVRAKAVYDAYTFPGTQLPDMPTYLADDHSICGPGHYCIAYRRFLERRCPTVHTRARARHGSHDESLDKSHDESLDKSQDGSRDSSDATNSLTDLDEMDTDGLLPMDMEASVDVKHILMGLFD